MGWGLLFGHTEGNNIGNELINYIVCHVLQWESVKMPTYERHRREPNKHIEGKNWIMAIFYSTVFSI